MSLAARLRLPTRPHLGRIELYVLTRSAMAVGAALGVIGAMIFLVNFIELSRTVGVRAKDASVPVVFGLTLLQSPSTILVLLPFAFLFGVLAAYVNMNRRSELVAMRAAGMSAWRFILPVGIAAALMGAATTTVLDPIAASLNDRYQRLESRLLEGYLHEEPKTIWLRQGDRRSQVIVRARRQIGEGVRLRDVSFFIYTLDESRTPQFTRRLDADSAVLSRGLWTLTNVREGVRGGAAIRSRSLTIASTLNERTALERFVSPAAIPFWSLPGAISRTENAGFSSTGYRLRLDQLLALPVLFAAMAVIGAAFSLRLQRLGGVGRLAGAGVAIGFAFFFLNQFCLALGRAGVIPPVMGAWTPPALALLAGLTLLAYTEDG